MKFKWIIVIGFSADINVAKHSTLFEARILEAMSAQNLVFSQFWFQAFSKYVALSIFVSTIFHCYPWPYLLIFPSLDKTKENIYHSPEV